MEEAKPLELLEIVKFFVTALTVAIAIASFIIARRADVRAKKAEDIKSLLGEKETVAFAALKLLKRGMPPNEEERRLLLTVLMQACVLEGSDRARALLFRVIEVNRVEFREELHVALSLIKQTFENMKRYEFTEKELDLGRGYMRIGAVEKVVNARETA